MFPVRPMTDWWCQACETIWHTPAADPAPICGTCGGRTRPYGFTDNPCSVQALAQRRR